VAREFDAAQRILLTGRVEVPDGTLVSVVGADPLSGGGVPDGGVVVLGGGEEQVSILVELDPSD
jgi:hypothetical protein